MRMEVCLKGAVSGGRFREFHPPESWGTARPGEAACASKSRSGRGAPVGKDSSVLTGPSGDRAGEDRRICKQIHGAPAPWVEDQSRDSRKQHKHRSCPQGSGELFPEDQRKARLRACQAELWCGLA